MSSSKSSDAFDLEHDLPTTAADTAALARLRPPAEADLLKNIGRLQPQSWLPPARDRERTSAGWEPFEL